MMVLPLLDLSGVFFWALAYGLIIWQGVRDRTYGVPMLALCINISWEFVFTFIFPPQPLQFVGSLVWFGLDAVIFFQFLKYVPRELPHYSLQTIVWITTILIFTIVASIIGFASVKDLDMVAAYTAFGDNALMSVLFIGLLQRRQSLRGQSLGIATSKFLGSILFVFTSYFFTPLGQQSWLLQSFFFIIICADIIYICMVIKHYRVAHPPLLTLAK